MSDIRRNGRQPQDPRDLEGPAAFSVVMTQIGKLEAKYREIIERIDEISVGVNQCLAANETTMGRIDILGDAIACIHTEIEKALGRKPARGRAKK